MKNKIAKISRWCLIIYEAFIYSETIYRNSILHQERVKIACFLRERDVFYPKKIKLWWGIIYIFYLFHVECEKEKARGGINNSVHNESFSSLVYLHQHHSTLNVGELSLYIWALYVTTCILREEFLEHKKLLGSIPTWSWVELLRELKNFACWAELVLAPIPVNKLTFQQSKIRERN